MKEGEGLEGERGEDRGDVPGEEVGKRWKTGSFLVATITKKCKTARFF